MKQQKLAGLIVSLTAATLLPGIAAAGSDTRKGANPNGKPFVELAGVIVEVEGELSSQQDQVDALVGRVDSVEQAQTEMEASIADLQTENVALQAQIDANAADVDSLEAEISALNGAILGLEQQIADLGDADGALQAQIDAHDASITTLALAIDTLDADLQASIDNNSALIAAMQQQIADIEDSLDLYQKLVSGSCPAGQAIREIGAEGSVICEVIDNSGSSAVTQLRAFAYGQTVDGTALVTATCPAGSVLTGGGFRGTFGSTGVLGGWPKTVWSGDFNSIEARQYVAEVKYAQYPGSLVTQAICLQFN